MFGRPANPMMPRPSPAMPMQHPLAARPSGPGMGIPRPAAPQVNPLTRQRAEVGLQLARQKFLADALRGGGPPRPGPNLAAPRPNYPTMK